MYPDADMPIVQLSINANFDPAEHLRLGQLIAPLRDQGVVVIGSGFSFHNTRAMVSGAGADASAAFDRWLTHVLSEASPEERQQQLIAWTEAPAARLAHPREDHLIPLMVAVGAAAQEPGERIYHQDDFMGAITSSSFRFGAPVVQAIEPRE